MDTMLWAQLGGVAGLGGTLMAGLLFSFTPVAFSSIPVVLAYVTRARAFKEALVYGGAFAASLILTHVLLGVGAALGGAWAQQLLNQQWGSVLGPVLIILGLIWAGWLKLPLPWLPMRGKRIVTMWGAFFLGIPSTVGICPMCSPGLWIGLGVSASVGSVIYGGLLMLAFAIGRVIPLVVGAVSLAWLENLKKWSNVGVMLLMSVAG